MASKRESIRLAMPAAVLTELEAAHATLQKLRIEARTDDRRSDAQQYADTQYLIREAMKLRQRTLRATK
jgi:hypothetical protein